jgi:hypothetical protein
MPKSTRQLLVKIPNYQCLYRHGLSGTYYAIPKIRGKRKEHSLKTPERKLAERKLKKWLADLEKIEADAERTSLRKLIDKYNIWRERAKKRLIAGQF